MLQDSQQLYTPWWVKGVKLAMRRKVSRVKSGKSLHLFLSTTSSVTLSQLLSTFWLRGLLKRQKTMIHIWLSESALLPWISNQRETVAHARPLNPNLKAKLFFPASAAIWIVIKNRKSFEVRSACKMFRWASTQREKKLIGELERVT